jgi:hypothetical protein
VDASSGGALSLAHTLTASVGVNNPIGGRDGQKLLLRITQGALGNHALTWGSAYEFSTLTRPILKTQAGHTDGLGFIYNAATGKWRYVAREDHHGNMLPASAWNA